MPRSVSSNPRKRAASKEIGINNDDNIEQKKPVAANRRCRKEQVPTPVETTSQRVGSTSTEGLTRKSKNRKKITADQGLSEIATDTVHPTARLTSSFFDQPCLQLARNLLGKRLVRLTGDGHRLVGAIVETEAYMGAEDRGCATFGGRRTPHNEAMYMTPGTSYVYMTYGMYSIINISSQGDGCAVLLRALEPIEGHELMKQGRCKKGKEKQLKDHELCNGPAKLAMALGITKSVFNQVDLSTCSSLWLEDGPPVADVDVVRCSRIGINNAGEWTTKPLRLYIRGNNNVSIRDKKAEDTEVGPVAADT